MHKEYKKEYNKKYAVLNRDTIRKQKREYQINRIKTDPLFRFNRNLRCLIKQSIIHQGFTKKSKTFQIIGCSFEEAILHFQSKFTDGMTIANHGEWHIDHIIPMSTAKTEEEAIKLNHISNLQPLWKDDNFKKSNKLDWTKNDNKGIAK